jgi:hypothetical protein
VQSGPGIFINDAAGTRGAHTTLYSPDHPSPADGEDGGDSAAESRGQTRLVQLPGAAPKNSALKTIRVTPDLVIPVANG